MTPAELLAFLQEFSRETLDLFKSRQTLSRSVAAYDANNGYQQVLGRQEIHLQWLADAISALGGTPADSPDDSESSSGRREQAKSLIEADARTQQAFIDRWTPRIGQVTNARNRKILDLILGEMKEHQRMISLAGENRTDLLGRHADGKVLRGEVMAVRPTN